MTEREKALAEVDAHRKRGLVAVNAFAAYSTMMSERERGELADLKRRLDASELETVKLRLEVETLKAELAIYRIEPDAALTGSPGAADTEDGDGGE